MNGCCKEVIEPSIKLARMVTLLKVLGFIHFVLIIGDLFLFGTGIFFFLLVQFLMLLIGISTKHFGQYLFFILICFFNIYLCISAIGAWFQVGFYKNDNPLSFGFLAFILIFEIFCVYVIFQTYKQAKHEYRIKMGYAPPEPGILGNNYQMNNYNDDNNNNNNFDDDDNENNNGPFQGNGIPVGGN